MAEGTELQGVAKTAANVAAGLMAFAGLLGILSLVLPWWTASEAGTLADQAAVSAEISLWDFVLDVAVQKNDASGGTSLQVESRDATWDMICEIGGQTANGAPEACSQIKAARAFCILMPMFAFISAAVFWISRTVSPLLLLVGVALAMFDALCAVIGIAVGVMVSTSGLQGGGILCLLSGMIVCFCAVSAGFYAAGVAMPIDVPKEKSRETRQERVEAQREKERQLAADLEANVQKNKNKDEGEFMDTDSEGEKKKSAPVMLRRVIFWSDEGGKDGEPIPLAMLEAAFAEMDEDGSGSIEMEELIENLELCDLHVPPQAANAIMAEIDEDQNGEISIHEFVRFFREVEELTQLQERTEQRAQFAQFLCNFCFIAHIIIVSVLLMNFIGIDSEEDPDGALIFFNMLVAFSFVLGVLLVCVICLPAARLTVGSNVGAWRRAWDKEVATRMAARKQEAPASPAAKRQAAWGEMNLEGLTQQTVNAAQFGSSYRLKNQQLAYQQQILQDAVEGVDFRPTGNGGVEIAPMMSSMGSMASRRSTKSGRSSRKTSKYGSQENASSGGGSRQAQGVVCANDGSMERYDPEAFLQAAMRSMETRPAATFNPMQMRDNSAPVDPPQMPGALALQDAGGPQNGMPTGHGFYQREL